MNPLEQLYRELLAAIGEGRITQQEANKRVLEATNGEIPGIASLELKLGAPRRDQLMRQMLTGARSALDGGTDPDEVDDAISRSTGGEIESLRELSAAVNPQSTAVSAVRGAIDSATLGFADEIGGGMRGLLAMVPGGDSPAEAYTRERDEMRAGLQAAQEQHPIATGAGQLAGAIALPGVGALRVGGAVGGQAAGRLGAAGATGLIGAAEGAAYDIGSGTQDTPLGLLDRVDAGTGISAGIGFAAGTGISGLMSLWRARGAGRIGRDQLAAELHRLTGLADGGMAEPQRQATEQLTKLSQRVWRPLERRYKSITDDPILDLIRETPEIRAAARRALDSAEYEYVLNGPGPGRRAPSFRSLQEVAESLRGRFSASRTAGDTFKQKRLKAAAAELTDAMETHLDGYAAARAQWRAASEAARSFDEGWKLFNAPPDRVRARMRELADNPEALENLRTGLAARLYDTLAKGGEVTRGTIDRLESAGMRGRIRNMFAKEADFHAFMSEVQKMGRANARNRKLRGFGRSVLRWTAAGAAGAGGYGILDTFFGN